MRKYSSPDIEKFLKAMDEFLPEKVELILIGGTAAALAYKVSRFTADIDTFNSIEKIKVSHQKAQKKLGLAIPIEQAAVSDAPYSFEDRLVSLSLGLRRLSIKVPEIHDFILMKTVRAYEHDLETIKEIVEKNRVDLAVLQQRFNGEMGHVIGDRERLVGNFLAMVEYVFGEEEAGKIAGSIE